MNKIKLQIDNEVNVYEDTIRKLVLEDQSSEKELKTMKEKEKEEQMIYEYEYEGKEKKGLFSSLGDQDFDVKL